MHWIHLRTTNPIESTFAMVLLRHWKTKGSGTRAATLAMIYKLCRKTEKGWRKLDGFISIKKLIGSRETKEFPKSICNCGPNFRERGIIEVICVSAPKTVRARHCDEGGTAFPPRRSGELVRERVSGKSVLESAPEDMMHHGPFRETRIEKDKGLRPLPCFAVSL